MKERHIAKDRERKTEMDGKYKKRHRRECETEE